jgi:hypothetical protein
MSVTGIALPPFAIHQCLSPVLIECTEQLPSVRGIDGTIEEDEHCYRARTRALYGRYTSVFIAIPCNPSRVHQECSKHVLPISLWSHYFVLWST